MINCKQIFFFFLATFGALGVEGKGVFPLGGDQKGLFEGDIKLTSKQEKVVKAAIKNGGIFLENNLYSFI